MNVSSASMPCSAKAPPSTAAHSGPELGVAVVYAVVIATRGLSGTVAAGPAAGATAPAGAAALAGAAGGDAGAAGAAGAGAAPRAGEHAATSSAATPRAMTSTRIPLRLPVPLMPIHPFSAAPPLQRRNPGHGERGAAMAPAGAYRPVPVPLHTCST